MKQRGQGRKKAREAKAQDLLAPWRALAESLLEVFRPFIEALNTAARQIQSLIETVSPRRQTDYTLIGGGRAAHFAHRGR
jgi:hypothetical protein